MRIYLAGTETASPLLKEIKPRYVLATFYSLRTQSKSRQKIINYINSDEHCKGFLLDSGAFTFFSAGTRKTENEWLRYADEFAEFITANNIKKYFELDIDVLTGIEFVEKIRSRIESRTGVQSIPVWHIERGWNYFKRMCDEYNYVALGGLVHNSNLRQIEKMMPYMVNYAHENNTEIHGLGYTALEKALRFGFDSVDSTSWLSGGRFGQIYKIKGCTLVGKTEKLAGMKLDGKAANRYNMNMWARYAEMLDR